MRAAQVMSIRGIIRGFMGAAFVEDDGRWKFFILKGGGVYCNFSCGVLRSVGVAACIS